MKNNIIAKAVPLGVLAATVTLLSVRSPISAESIVGYVSILGVLAVAALEYRINVKWLLGR